LALFPALTSLTAASADQSPPEEKTSPRLEIAFDYRRQNGIASNQFAVWIEDALGKHVETLYATRFTASGGWRRRPACLPDWVAAARADTLSSGDVDAITGATPSAGRLRYAWDGKDHGGRRVAPGSYRVVVEANLRWDNRVLYRGEIEIGGPAQILRPDPEFVGDADQALGMITNVVVRYVP
jgi:hypothetical protein